MSTPDRSADEAKHRNALDEARARTGLAWLGLLLAGLAAAAGLVFLIYSAFSRVLSD